MYKPSFLVSNETNQGCCRSKLFSLVGISQPLLGTSTLETQAFRSSHYSHRRLTVSSSSILDKFRAVSGKGMRGMMDGDIYPGSSALDCAQRCIADTQCLSFDFEIGTAVCYVSHTDRYIHPEAFLSFPTGIYYEWQGTASAPTLYPNGGEFATQVTTRVFTAQLAARIYYRILPTSYSTTPTIALLFGSDQTYLTATTGDIITLPTYSCRIYAITVKAGLDSSTLVVSRNFIIYGKVFLFLV